MNNFGQQKLNFDEQIWKYLYARYDVSLNIDQPIETPLLQTWAIYSISNMTF